jgi:hypothetical protein
MKLRMNLVDKHELYARHVTNPTQTYAELAAWAVESFMLISTPSKSTIGNAIKRHKVPSLRADNKTRSMDRDVALPEVEQRVLEWVLRCEELGVCLTGELIRKQALVVCTQLSIPETRRLSFSKGWLYKFQRKHGLTSKIQHGEAASTPPDAVNDGRQAIQQATAGYNDKDVYNMDETAFFYCMSPHRSITRSRVLAQRSQKRGSLLPSPPMPMAPTS